jgi:hypothetical protein
MFLSPCAVLREFAFQVRRVHRRGEFPGLEWGILRAAECIRRITTDFRTVGVKHEPLVVDDPLQLTIQPPLMRTVSSGAKGKSLRGLAASRMAKTHTTRESNINICWLEEKYGTSDIGSLSSTSSNVGV